MGLVLERNFFSLQLDVLSPPIICLFILFALEAHDLELQLLGYGISALSKTLYILARVITCYLCWFLVVEAKPIWRQLLHSAKNPEKRSMPRRGLGLQLPSVSISLLDDAIASCAIRLRRFSRPAVKQGLRRVEWICASKTKSQRVSHH